MLAKRASSIAPLTASAFVIRQRRRPRSASASVQNDQSNHAGPQNATKSEANEDGRWIAEARLQCARQGDSGSPKDRDRDAKRARHGTAAVPDGECQAEQPRSETSLSCSEQREENRETAGDFTGH